MFVTPYFSQTVIMCPFCSLFHKADKSGDDALSFEEFEQSLKEMDKNLTHLPPTAQVSTAWIQQLCVMEH